MDQLCNDVLLMILSFCFTKDILHVAQLSRRFYDIVTYGIQKRYFVNKKLRIYQRSKSVKEKPLFDWMSNQITINLLVSHGFLVVMDDHTDKVRFIFHNGKIVDHKFFYDRDPLCIRKYAHVVDNHLMISTLLPDFKLSVSINLDTLRRELDIISREDTILDEYFGKGLVL